MMDYAGWRKRPQPQLLAFLEARRPPAVTQPPPPPDRRPPPRPPRPRARPRPRPPRGARVARRRDGGEGAPGGVRGGPRGRAGARGAVGRAPPAARVRAAARQDALGLPAGGDGLAGAGLRARAQVEEAGRQEGTLCRCTLPPHTLHPLCSNQERARQPSGSVVLVHRSAASAGPGDYLTPPRCRQLVEWKRERRVERARKQALDEQLSYIVDRTERYSRQLAANLHGAAPDTPPSDDEFTPRGASSDDEETIAAAEREARHDAAHHRRELLALRSEADQALPDLLPPGYPRAAPAAPASPASSDYSAAQDSTDDEATIAAQEREERAAGPRAAQDEIDALQQEADLDLEELRRRYAAAPHTPHTPHTPRTSDIDDSDDHDDDVDSDDGTPSGAESDSDSSGSECSASSRLSALVGPEGGAEGRRGGAAGSERRVEAAASLAATLQPTGTTLQSTAVGTPVPRLLRHPLREYQHVGLHWLATMHARRLNGILADEMGLGKTIQTIALLAHLALERRDWGPHLVVAPTSVVLNWEMEFKKWCPAFKVLTYYGTIKERKLKRVGWTKPNCFHVCITSYKLVVQDHQSFRRKRWRYLVLDEAQNIKNFKSQRWQMLLNFHTDRRLLLTGTPLQNSLLELWSLMHFLMPDVFASHSEFREWFQPVAALAGAEGAGGGAGGGALVRRLHEVLRPFLLRRLKADVERQMPRKYEHVLLCRLAKRQRCLYDDFMARAKTKESLASGNLLSVINVLMQLRKVCNHPDLFEPRPVSSPLLLPALRLRVPALALHAGVTRRARAAARLAGDLASLEAAGAGAFAAHRARHLAPPRRLVEELHDHDHGAPPPRPRPRACACTCGWCRARRPRPPPRRRPPCARPTRRPPSPRRRRRRRPRRARRRHRPRRGAAGGAPARVPAPAGLRQRAPLLAAAAVQRVLARVRGGGAAAGGGRGAGARGWRRAARACEEGGAPPARALLAALHGCAAPQRVAFPHPRLLQYDCGKLQALAPLLRRLKAGGHRVLIFTQMTRVLDVLEGFLSLHGHAYARLDGATRVDRRQALVDRFNADPRLFAFILSTRSGGVGLNLTGADCVVFYDSDWNPTMDAQAQDRCHRIGQTRDVHVFRLVTQATVEENILRKAEQKRRLGSLAIDDGHFTTTYLREWMARGARGAGGGGGVAAGGELESALLAAEDEADAAAARAARSEQQGELAEFDETLPLADEPAAAAAAAAAPTDEHAALMDQLTPIEKYAMRIVESSEEGCEAERAALSAVRRALGDARRRLRDPDPTPTPARPRPRPRPRAHLQPPRRRQQGAPPSPPRARARAALAAALAARRPAAPAPRRRRRPRPRHAQHALARHRAHQPVDAGRAARTGGRGARGRR
ncbi:hypothetical protein MSG28_008149, partial [Choristoneura fumiferana]